ncbi:toxin-antitoxin system HicB family antitoxin [Solidesulfovibrio sp.]
METTIVNIRKFPVELHRQAKVAAAKEGIPLQEWFKQAVEEKLGRDAKK